MRNKPTPHCQSMIKSSLSVRAEKMMKKNSGRFSQAPLLGIPSSFVHKFFASAKLLSQPLS